MFSEIISQTEKNESYEIICFLSILMYKQIKAYRYMLYNPKIGWNNVVFFYYYLWAASRWKLVIKGLMPWQSPKPIKDYEFEDNYSKRFLNWLSIHVATFWISHTPLSKLKKRPMDHTTYLNNNRHDKTSSSMES